MQPPPNSRPYFTTPTPVTAVLNEGESATWSFEVRDNDLDPLVLSLVTDGFVLADAGMTFTFRHKKTDLSVANFIGMRIAIFMTLRSARLFR